MSDFSPGYKVTKGSTIAAGSATDTHQFTGSVYISDSLYVDGSEVTPGGGGGAGIAFDGTTANGVATRKNATTASIESKFTYDGANENLSLTGTFNHTGSHNISGTLTLTGPIGVPLLVMDDSDASAQIGRTHLGYDGTNSDMAVFAHQDMATQTNFALRQRSTGQTELNATSGQSISFKISSANKATLNSSGHFNLLDNIKLLLGTGEDASIQYDETGTDKLIISGAAGGFDIDLPDNSGDAFAITEEGNLYLKIATTNGQEHVAFHKAAQVIDDTKLYFGSDFDVSLEYDEDGTDTLVCDGGAAGVGLTMADDIYLYFGTGLDAKMYYDESGNDELIISGAQGGIDIQAPAPVADALTLSSNGETYVTIDSRAGQNKKVQFSQAPLIIDNVGLYFGSTGDMSLEYDADGTETLLVDGGAEGAGMTMADDVYLYFGTGKDAKMYYDESGNDELIISGADGGIDIQGPAVTGDAITFTSNGEDYITISTLAGQNKFVKFSQSTMIIDNTGLYFGNTGDMSLEYDADGSETLLVDGGAAGAGMAMADDVFLYLGTGKDAKMYYNDTANKLIISGTVQASDITGSVKIGDGNNTVFHVDSINDSIKINANTNENSQVIINGPTSLSGSDQYDVLLVEAANETKDNGRPRLLVNASGVGLGESNPLVACAINWAPNDLANDTGGGERVSFGDNGGSDLTKGALYYLHTNGIWIIADADAATTGGQQLLGISLGTNPQADGMLIRGWFHANSHLNNHSTGKRIFVSATDGKMDTTAPAGSGDIVRVVGYCAEQSNIMYFNPDGSYTTV